MDRLPNTVRPPSGCESIPAARGRPAAGIPTGHSGGEAALADLVSRWEGPVYRIARRITGSAEEAEDARQEVFLSLFSTQDAIRQPEAIAGWIYRTTVNAALGRVRSRSRYRAYLDRFYRLIHDPGGHSPRADAVAAQLDEVERLDRAQRHLDPEDRAVLALRFDEGRSFAEIATILGRPASTIKSRYGRAIKRLHALLGDPQPCEPRRTET